MASSSSPRSERPRSLRRRWRRREVRRRSCLRSRMGCRAPRPSPSTGFCSMVSLDPSRAMDLSGCVALVTGASRGIGRAIAIELARHGAAVGINYTQSEPDAESVAAEVADLGAEAVVVQADVSDVDAVDRMFAA